MEKALKTLKEMLYDRSQFDPYYKPISDACNNLVISDTEKYVLLPCTIDFCIVFDLRKKVESLQVLNFKHIILITKDNINKKESVEKKRIEYFDLFELSFNISKHSLVPKHTIVMKDKQTIMSDYNIKSILMLPHILHTDPVARYIGAKKGDVVEITRNSITSGIHITYRICV